MVTTHRPLRIVALFLSSAGLLLVPPGDHVSAGSPTSEADLAGPVVLDSPEKSATLTVVDVSLLPADGYFATHPEAATTGRADAGSIESTTELNAGLLAGTSDPITAGSCTYTQNVDTPHRSGGDVSVHGSWRRVSGTCPRESNVDTYLQAWWCDSWFGCRWVTVASNSDDVRAGGGRGRRVTARKSCTPYTRDVSWRGLVDVDLIGQSDPGGRTESFIGTVRCAPS
ncbi:MAG: hypothetical protein AAFP84_01185 [Actinomycetota bacterium]